MHKRVLTINIMFLVVSAVLLMAVPQKVSAQTATIPLGHPAAGASAALCQYTSNTGQRIRAVVAKGQFHFNAWASIFSAAQVPGTALHASNSSAWWGNVTVVEVPASNWYMVSLVVENSGGSGRLEVLSSGYIATAYTPYC